MRINKYTIEDCNKYFGDTYVQFKEEIENNLFYFLKVDSKYIYAINVFTNENIVISLEEEYNIDFNLPRKTVFNMDGFAFMITRIPAQMWKKGIHSKNTCFYKLTNNGWSRCEILATYLKHFIKYKEYFNYNIPTKESKAISPRISINNQGDIYIDMIKVAELRDNIVFTHSLFISDLSPFFKDCEIRELK